MTENTYRVAIIGAGMIANAGHIPAWQDLEDEVEVVGVANIHIGKAEETAERYDIPHAYSDTERMLEELEPDIVSICTPNAYHKEGTLAALAIGAHVLCEKPVAPSYEDAKTMFEAAEAADRLLCVAQTIRFSSQNMAAKEMADAGRLGEIYYAETSSMRRRGVPTWGTFHMEKYAGGGALCDIGVHSLDLLLWLMGNPRVVAASGQTYTKLADRGEGLVTSLADSGAPVGVFTPRPYDPGEFDVEDMAAGFLRLENGCTISLKASWAANVPQGYGGTIILGTEGGLTLDPLTLISIMDKYQVDVKPRVPADPDVPFYGHWKLAAHFLRAIKGEEDLLVKKEEVLNVTRALEGLYRSAEEGREVWL